MTQNEQERAKERAIQCRKEGGSLYDCAVMAGVDESTLYRWRDDDARFASDLELALIEFKKSLIRGTKIKKPEFLLERRWKEEYGPPKDESKGNITNIQINVGDDAIAEYITGIVQGIPLPAGTSSSETDAAGTEGGISNQDSAGGNREVQE